MTRCFAARSVGDQSKRKPVRKFPKHYDIGGQDIIEMSRGKTEREKSRFFFSRQCMDIYPQRVFNKRSNLFQITREVTG